MAQNEKWEVENFLHTDSYIRLWNKNLCEKTLNEVYAALVALL